MGVWRGRVRDGSALPEVAPQVSCQLLPVVDSVGEIDDVPV
jgi:hypothetical protein